MKETSVHVLRFDKGEEIISQLSSYCKKEKVLSGFFTALGACLKVTIAYYDLENKKYLDQTTEEDLEIIGITGNVSQMAGKHIVHAHGSFAGKDYKVFGGHIKELVVSATCEVHLTILQKKIERDFDKETGLNLFK
ncbi:MAG: DNA-binding protein [bacterium]|nr:DNA-binding protein [bacterium]